MGGGLLLGWLLWRVQLRMFINQTIGSRKPGRIVGTIAAGLILLFLWIWEGLVTLLAVVAIRRVQVHVDLVQLLSLAFFAYVGILIFSSLLFSLNALLLNPDLDLLLVAPRPVDSVLAGRMVVQFLRLVILGLLFTLPALLVLTVALRNPLILPVFTTLYALYPVLPVVLISLATLFLVRFIPPGRGKEIVTILSIALALGLNLANFLLNPALRGSAFTVRRGRAPSFPDFPLAGAPWLPSGWAGRMAAGILQGDWALAAAWGVVLLLVSVVLFTAGTMLGGRLYLAGWIQAVPNRRRRARHATERHSRLAIPLLDPVMAAIVIKDWRMRTRDLAQLARFVMPLVFLVLLFGLRFSSLPRAVQALGEGPTAALLALFPAWVLLLSLSSALGLTAISLEGRSIWIYAVSPNSLLRFVQAKCWSAALPIAAVTALVAGGSEIVIRPGWPWALSAVLLAVVQAAAITSVMVGLGGIFARFEWTDVRRMMHPAAGLLGVAVFAVVTGASALLMVIAVALSSLTHAALATTWLGALVLSIGGATAVAAIGVLLAVERLSRLELP